MWSLVLDRITSPSEFEDTFRMRRPLRWIIGLTALGVLAFLVSRCFVVVDETEYVLVTEFGRTVDVLGDDPGEAGLHLKRPWQSSLAVDRRLRVFDPPP